MGEIQVHSRVFMDSTTVYHKWKYLPILDLKPIDDFTVDLKYHIDHHKVVEIRSNGAFLPVDDLVGSVPDIWVDTNTLVIQVL